MTPTDAAPIWAWIGENIDGLATEQARRELADLDERSPAELVTLLLESEAGVPALLQAAAPELAAAVELAAARLAVGGRMLYVGAGTPGRLAALDAAECVPTFGVPPTLVHAVLAGGDRALRTAVEGVEDAAEQGARDLADAGMTDVDVVVGISASGRTPYVRGALEHAKRTGAPTVAIVNNPGSPIAAVADIAIELPTGPEVVAGSTRLSAGTAQKIALNVLSTATMVRLGKTYGPWLVDMLATNHKLRRRSVRIVREITGVGEDEAVAALSAAGGEVKTAVVTLLTGVDIDVARARLRAANGRVRQALAVEQQ